jgi:hypothetical protein
MNVNVNIIDLKTFRKAEETQRQTTPGYGGVDSGSKTPRQRIPGLRDEQNRRPPGAGPSYPNLLIPTPNSIPFVSSNEKEYLAAGYLKLTGELSKKLLHAYFVNVNLMC